MRFMSEEYQNYLIQVGRYSPLFSTDEAPLIQYRTAEKIFCKSFELEDIGRKDASFDARQDDLGIGIKTFVMHNKNKREKIAEFVKDAPLLKDLSGITLAKELSNLRNKRIAKHREQYNISKSIYHLVTRTIKKIRVFECAYNFIDIDSLKIQRDNSKNFWFIDNSTGTEYSFLRSKTTLSQNFILPDQDQVVEMDVDYVYSIDQILSFGKKPLASS